MGSHTSALVPAPVPAPAPARWTDGRLDRRTNARAARGWSAGGPGRGRPASCSEPVGPARRRAPPRTGVAAQGAGRGAGPADRGQAELTPGTDLARETQSSQRGRNRSADLRLALRSMDTLCLEPSSARSMASADTRTRRSAGRLNFPRRSSTFSFRTSAQKQQMPFRGAGAGWTRGSQASWSGVSPDLGLLNLSVLLREVQAMASTSPTAWREDPRPTEVVCKG